MNPTLQLGFLTLHGYGLAIGLGALLGYRVIQVQARQHGPRSLERQLLPLAVVVAVAAAAGGRLVFLAFDPGGAGLRSGLVAGQGFVFYGSLLFSLPALWVYLHVRKLPVLPSLDAIAVGIPVIHAMGRLGCFLAGCCHGTATDLPWAVTFRNGHGVNGVPIHPVQLYEAGGNLLLFVWLSSERRKVRPPGWILTTYVALYSALRLATEFVRGDARGLLTDCATPWTPGSPGCIPSLAQGVSVALLALSCLAFWYLDRRNAQGRPGTNLSLRERRSWP